MFGMFTVDHSVSQSETCVVLRNLRNFDNEAEKEQCWDNLLFILTDQY